MNPNKRLDAKSGASMIESVIVVMVMSLVLFGGIQLTRVLVAREVIDYAAMAGARARAVGLNNFMVYKVVRVASIPNAGRMLNPDTPMAAAAARGWDVERSGDLWDAAVGARAPYSPMAEVERQRIPFYLGGENVARLRGILDYEDWRTITHQISHPSQNEVRVRVHQRFPLRVPLRRAFYRDETVDIHAGGRDSRGARMAAHSELYLQ